MSGLLAKIAANPTITDIDRMLYYCVTYRETYGPLVDKCLDIRLELMAREGQ